MTSPLPRERLPRTLSLCAAALTCAAVLATPVDAMAQTLPALSSAPLQLALPTQPLAQTLNALSRQSGVAIGADGTLLSGKTAPALRGALTLQQALDKVLDGSGLMAVRSGPSTLSIQRRPASTSETALQPVTVTAAAARAGRAERAYRVETTSLGALGEKSLRDTPFSIDVISRELMDNTQAHSLVDAVKGDASIAVGSNYTNGTGEVLKMRGLLLSYRNNYKLDGQDLIGFLGAPQIPIEHLEGIEVLKGAGGFLYGFGTPGGIVNMVTKRPTAAPRRSITTQITDSGALLVHGDIGGRFGQDDRFGYRVNLVNEQGDTYVDDGGRIKRRSASVALDWRLASNLVLSLDAMHQERKVDAVYYQLVPNANGAASNYTIAAAPGAVNGSVRLASPFTYSETRSTTYGATLAWTIAPGWDARASYRRWDQDMFSNHSFLFANAAGNYAEQQISLPSSVNAEQGQMLVTGALSTGGLRHDLTFGLTYTDLHAQESNDFKSAVLGTGNLARPGNFADPGLTTTWIGDGWTFPERQRSIFVSDTLHLGERWDLIAGVRHNSFTSNAYDKSAVTPTVAVVFRPVPWLSTYGSYVEALEQGAVAPRAALNANEVFPPLKSKQVEFGVKAEGADWTANAALFRMTQAATYYTAAGLYTQDGESRYQGFELSAKARLARQWTVLASAVFLDAESTKTSLGQYDGKRVAGASRQQYAAYAEYGFASLPVTLSAGARYVSARPLDVANQWELPGYALFDLGARYVTRMGATKTTWRVNVDNVADKAYWMMAGSNRLVQGAPRTLKLSAQFEF